MCQVPFLVGAAFRPKRVFRYLSPMKKSKSLGGDLVSIETEEEWNFIADEIQMRNASIPKNGWSIGLMKKAGNWTWVSGTPLTISKWGDGQPSGDGKLTHIYKQSSNGERVVIGDCSEDFGSGYICEISRGRTNLPFC